MLPVCQILYNPEWNVFQPFIGEPGMDQASEEWNIGIIWNNNVFINNNGKVLLNVN